MEVEIVEDKQINHMRSFKNGIVSIGMLQKFAISKFIFNKETYFKDREMFDELLNSMLEDVYASGYNKGLRENKGESNEKQSINNWDREKVYPKAGTGQYQGD